MYERQGGYSGRMRRSSTAMQLKKRLREDRYNVERKLTSEVVFTVIRRGCALTRRIWAEKAMRMVTVREETATEDNGGELYRLCNRKHRELPTMGSVERASSQGGGGKEDRGTVRQVDEYGTKREPGGPGGWTTGRSRNTKREANGGRFRRRRAGLRVIMSAGEWCIHMRQGLNEGEGEIRKGEDAGQGYANRDKRAPNVAHIWRHAPYPTANNGFAYIDVFVERKWKTGLESFAREGVRKGEAFKWIVTNTRERRARDVRMADVGDGWAMEGIRGPQGATVYLAETEESIAERAGRQCQRGCGQDVIEGGVVADRGWLEMARCSAGWQYLQGNWRARGAGIGLEVAQCGAGGTLTWVGGGPRDLKVVGPEVG
ncbi:hypothetical protein B0H13DRAFT_1882525 [Mycena leptocephala]|nr:hypothetical protein B0H13DRAFT_1882525 [Mycena leptocephala]